jgi:4-amino-4-deoxy-L-arabinose transferase-like glycosyltransferase
VSAYLRVDSARRTFWVAALCLVIFKLALSAILPITGDEAYFYYWGVNPDLGFYDHPPMVGWWLTVQRQLLDATWFLRLTPALLPLLAAWVAWQIVYMAAHDLARAWWAALIVLLAPAHVWNVFVTTDTPLIAFSLISVLAYCAALNSGRRGAALLLQALAGIFLGLAFLSKYFAVFLGAAYLFHVAFVRDDASRWRGFFLLLLFALPGPALNIWWNSEHCWANLLFNLYNRHEGSGLSWKTTPLYGLTLAYVLSPFAPIAAWRYRSALGAAMRERGLAAALLWLAGIPFLLFALLSPVKTIGLHWLLSFVPLALAGMALALPAPVLPKLGRGLIGFAALHAAVIVVVLALPLSTWKNSRLYDGLVLTFRSQQLIDRLKPLEADYAFASDGYSNAVTLGYNARRYFFVFGIGSSHARHDDLLTDLRRLDGKNIAILRKSAPAAGDYEPYFERTLFESFVVDGVSFHLVKGEGFRYAAYRDGVLKTVRDRWYRLPAYLPTRACYFCDRYFPGEAYPQR